MGAVLIDYARSAFDLIGKFELCSTLNELTLTFSESLKEYGYASFIITGVPEPPAKLESSILINKWPDGFSKQYTKSNYYPDDPIAERCRLSLDPYEWSDVQIDSAKRPRSAQVLRLAADFGMKRGFCVPVLRGSGSTACVTMAGERPDYNPKAKQAIHLVSMFAHARAIRIRDPKANNRIGCARLTKRERQALQWASAGKSAWEVAKIMNISCSTATQFLASAQKKLNASNRTHAVVLAIQANEIRI